MQTANYRTPTKGNPQDEADALAAVYSLILGKRIKKPASASSVKDSASAATDAPDKPEHQPKDTAA